MATFTYAASYSSSLEQEPRILNAKFGDGYEQNTYDGINYNPQKWSLTFQNISKVDALSILNFFKTNNTPTTSFVWENPEGVSSKYLCKKWSRNYSGFDQMNVSCMFEEVFW